MDKRSGRSSSNRTGKRVASTGKKTTSQTRKVRTTNAGTTRKIPTVSDETKMFKLDDEIMKNKGSKSNTKKKTKAKGKKEKNKVWNIIKKILLALFILGILAGLIIAGILAGIFLGFFGDDFKMTKADLSIPFSNSEVYDADGNLICTLNGTEQRKIVSLEQMPEYLPKAYVAIEDERFYEHSGVDIKRTGAATVTYLLHAGKSSFGGSTITQQLVKNITDEDEDSAMRKVKEMARAIQIEKEISKDEILELYLNIIFVGGNNINGVALGAEYYFNKNVSTLDIAESAFLAGINHTPNSYNPFTADEAKNKANIENGKQRTKTVLAKMKELKYITDDEYNAAVAEVENGLAFSKGTLAADTIYTSHTEAAINQIVEQLMSEKGMSREMAETKVYGGGYKIYTTQVTTIQNTMQEEMSKDKYIMTGKKKNADGTLINAQSQAAMVVIDHTTGNVVGCVGNLGTKTKNGDLNRATQSKRQVGSAMKPLSVIGPAVQEGVINASSVYEDKAIDWYGAPVKNYYNGYKGKQTVREAIRISGNIIPITILRDTGLSKSISYLNKMGLTGIDESVGLTLALGAKEFSPLEIAAAYATIANDGVYIQPTFYTKVLDADGNLVIEPHQTRTEVFSKSNDYIIKSIVTEPVVGSGGTATYCRMSGYDVAAKTGTTDNDYDRWLCEFTPYYTAACWYGYDINEEVVYTKASPTNPAGGICSAVMKSIHSSLALPAKTFTKPDDIVTATVCKDSGLLPSPTCTNLITDIFVKGRVPTSYCSAPDSQKEYAICEDTGLLAIEGVCPHIIYKKFIDDTELPPTESCNVHKAPTPAETTTPSPTTTTKPTPTETTSPSPTTTTKPTPTETTTPSPTTTTKPSPSPTDNATN